MPAKQKSQIKARRTLHLDLAFGIHLALEGIAHLLLQLPLLLATDRLVGATVGKQAGAGASSSVGLGNSKLAQLAVGRLLGVGLVALGYPCNQTVPRRMVGVLNGRHLGQGVDGDAGRMVLLPRIFFLDKSKSGPESWWGYRTIVGVQYETLKCAALSHCAIRFTFNRKHRLTRLRVVHPIYAFTHIDLAHTAAYGNPPRCRTGST